MDRNFAISYTFPTCMKSIFLSSNMSCCGQCTCTGTGTHAHALALVQNMWHHLSKQLTVSYSYSLCQQYTFAIHKYNTDMCVVQN